MNDINFTVADTIAGYVISFNRSARQFSLKTSDGRDFTAALTPTTYARVAYNLDEPYQDCTGQIPELLAVEGQFVYAYGVFYPEPTGHASSRSPAGLPGERPRVFRHEEPDWWIKQVRSIADCYLKWQFDYPGSRSTTGTTARSCTWPAPRRATTCRKPTRSRVWSTASPRRTC